MGEIILWLFIAIVAVATDMMTGLFLFVWFAIGSIAAIVANLYGASMGIQIIIFSVVSIILVLIGYPMIRRRSKKEIKKIPLMEEKYIGMEFIAEDDIEASTRIKVGGIYWGAVNQGETIKKGQKFRIIGLMGNEFIIKSILEEFIMKIGVIAVIAVVVLIVIVSSVKIVNTGYLYVVERFGQFHKVLEPGWHFMIPFVDFVRKKVSTKQQILDVPPQSVITKDNVKISVDNVIFYKLLNAQDAVYNIEDYSAGIVYSATTNMRNIIGNMTLDEVLSGRDKINQDLLSIIDEVTDAYGIKILSVEIKNIIPPAEIQQAMEKQMKAERDKRAMILQAEGLRKSEVEKAEGEKQAKILAAEAEKEAQIRRAEGLKESQLLEAEGKAKAIEAIASAEAEAIKKVNEAIISSGTDERVIALKQVEALKEMAKNPANKLILPNETLSSLGSIAAIGDMLKGQQK